MGRWKTWVGLFFVFALATVGVSTAIHGGMGGFGRFLNRPIAVAPTASTAPTAAAPTATPFASEQDWIAAQIVRAIAEAGAFANHRDLTAGPRVKVAMGEHIWAPDMYVDAARAHLGVRMRSPRRAPSGSHSIPASPSRPRGCCRI